MRFAIPAAAMSAALLAGCAGVHVRTTAVPQGQLTDLRTFAVLDNDRPLTHDLIARFEARGYTLDSVKPDFTVTYHATTNESEYHWPPGWWGPIAYPARVSDDPQTYAKELDKTVEAIVDRFPSTH